MGEGWDENRYYFKLGDIIDISSEYIVVCTEYKGWKKASEFVVVKGFNKGQKVYLNHDQLPYISKIQYREFDFLAKAYSYTKENLMKPKLGDIFIDNGKYLY